MHIFMYVPNLKSFTCYVYACIYYGMYLYLYAKISIYNILFSLVCLFTYPFGLQNEQ